MTLINQITITTKPPRPELQTKLAIPLIHALYLNQEITKEGSVYNVSIFFTHHRSTIFFPVVKEFHSGSYLCKITNTKGIWTKTFEVKVNSSDGPIILYVIIIIACGVIALAIVIFVFLRILKKQRMIGRLTELEIEEFEKGLSQESAEDMVQELALLLPYDRNYEIPKCKLIIEKDRILGKGQFGMVYKGKIDGVEDEVAFKTIKTTESSDHLKSLLSELKIMIYIGKHENVIGLLGAYTAELRDGIAYIAAEFCSLGSLEKYLQNYSHSGTSVPETSMNCSNTQGILYQNINNVRVYEIPTPQLIKWSFQIANGMEWLTSKKVIHGDLAARNVLLTANKTVKITDFGLSRRLYEYTTYVKESQEPLPWRWMAIESLRSMNFSTQSDVWSYGITLWEIFSFGDIPYPGLSWHIEFVKDLEKGLRLSIPKYATELIFDKMFECWRSEPNQRPNFSELVSFFNELELN